jgi:hypothetical protein
MPSSDLKRIFDYVLEYEWSTARQIGRMLDEGKSRANHYLYGYIDILFEKRGITPPQWRVTSPDAYERLMGRIQPTSPAPKQPAAAPVTRRKAPSIFSRAVSAPREMPFNLPSISVCQSCDLPIQPTGRCGCS